MSTSSRRAKASGISLLSEDASLIKGMLARGDREHDIAAYFGVNGGRISEIATRSKFATIAAAPAEELPPSGPYVSRSNSALVERELIAALTAIEKALASLAGTQPR